MGGLRQRFPVERAATAAEVLAQVSAAGGDGLSFGDRRIVDFLADLGVRLARAEVARRHPELVPLGYFLRRANLTRMLDALFGGLLVPRGLVFHIPPGNVPALLVYPWALSALAGNANVVRLPTRGSPVHESLLGHLRAAAAAAADIVAATQVVVSYGHDDAVTGAFGDACQLRVVWGGDEAIERLRRIPVPPATRDLVFPDRCSLAALSVPAWSAAAPAARADLVERFANDAYWYGQAACASPLTICWIGAPRPAAAAAREFLDLLGALVRRRSPEVDPVQAVEQRVRTYGLALDGTAVSLRYPGNALAVAELVPGRLLEHWSGTGTFGVVQLRGLADLAPLVHRRQQTLAYFGFTAEELSRLVQALGDRAFDRIVPIGQALAFDGVWNGYDLLREFSRPVVLR